MPQLKVRIGCVVLAVIMSALTYYFVEPRLRWGRYGGYKAAGLLSIMVAVGIAGYSVERHEGYTARMDDQDKEIINAINKRLDADNLRCLRAIPDWNDFSGENTCLIQREPGENTIALIGDSHARHLYSGMATKTDGKEGVAVFPASCAIPLIGLHSGIDPNLPDRVHSEHLLSEAFSYVLSHRNIKKVVLSHLPACSWNNVVDTKNPYNRNHDLILHDGFVRTYDALSKAGKDIYVVLDNPGYSPEIWQKCKAVIKRPVPIPGFLSTKAGKSCSVKPSDRLDKKEVSSWKSAAIEASSGYDIHFIDLEHVFCRDNNCSMLDQDGNMMYRDWTHLNIRGSAYAAGFIFSKLRE